MVRRPVIEYPHNALRQRCRRVTQITPAINRLIDDMVETMREARGVGLAAPQIGEIWRIATIEIPKDEEEKDPHAGKLFVLINPEIVRVEDNNWEPEEGCLSYPGYVANVKRYKRVVAKAQDRRGKEIRVKGSGLLAQAIQHEVDHLNGVMFFDHLASMDLLRPLTDEDEQL